MLELYYTNYFFHLISESFSCRSRERSHLVLCLRSRVVDDISSGDSKVIYQLDFLLYLLPSADLASQLRKSSAEALGLRAIGFV